MSSRRKAKASGANLVRKMSKEKLTDTLYEVAKWSPADVVKNTTNRTARRKLAKSQRQHGRGFTKRRNA